MPALDEIAERRLAPGAHLYWVVSVGAGALAAVLGAGGHPNSSLWFAVVASLALVALAAKSSKGFNTILVVFAVFHMIYGLSGPFAAVYGAHLPLIFTEPYETSAFLYNYSLATVGFALGLVAARPGHAIEPMARRSGRTPRLLAQYGILLACAASAMEMINCVRAGGLAVVLQGKEVYQSLTTALALDLPSNEMAMLATAVMALAVGMSRTPGWPRTASVLRIHVATFVLALLPLLTIVVLLGQRGLLLGWVLIALVGATYGASVRRISGTLASLAIAVYLGMGLIYVNRSARGAALFIGDWSAVFRSAWNQDALRHAFDPAANEFGITLGNFSEYVKTGDHQLGLGRSYAVGLLLPVPSSLYPWQKPQQVSFEFRDRVFPGEAERGAIAGTAYSSILEAYYNFKEFGVWGIYLLIGMVLVTIERWRSRSGSLWFALIYLMLLPSAVSFHRSSFGDAVISPSVLNLAVLAAFWVVSSFVETALTRRRKVFYADL